MPCTATSIHPTPPVQYPLPPLKFQVTNPTTAGTSGTSDSVAHGSHISETNPGVLHSTEAGIHGQRDPGTGVTPGHESRTGGTSGLTGGNTGSTLGSSGTTSTTGSGLKDTLTGDHHKTGQQYDATGSRHENLHDPALDRQQQQPLGGGATHGHHHDRTHDTTTHGTTGTSTSRGDVPARHPEHGLDTNTTTTGGLTGTGSGYDSNNRDRGIVAGTGAAAAGGALGAGATSHHDRDRDLTGSGSGRDTGIGGTTGGLGGAGTGYGSNTTSGPHGSNLANKADPRGALFVEPLQFGD